MRIVVIIAATLMLVITAGIGFLGTNRSLTDAEDIDKTIKPIEKQLDKMAAAGSTRAKKLKDLSEKTSSLRAGAVFFGLMGLLAVALVVMMFMDKAVPYAAAGLVLVALLSIFVNPQYDLGPTAPASARSLAYVAGVIAALGAAAAYGASALKKRKQAAVAA
jgi:hypothetical protein